MSVAKKAWHWTASITIVALLANWVVNAFSADDATEYPNAPIQVVVPFGAGGGSDTFVRTMQKGIVEDNLLPQPLVIVNQPGGTATIGSREVKNAEPDGYKVLCLHNAIITAKLANTVDYGPEAFDAIAMTGKLSLVVMVREDAPYKDLRGLLEDAKRRPKEVRFGANKGAPAFFATLQMEKAWPGADFNIVSGKGGAERYGNIIGGHLEAGIFSLSEYLDYRLSDDAPAEQNVRAIAVLDTERHPSIPDVPCSFEQEIPVLLSNAHYWWAPKGTPAFVKERLASALERAMQNSMVESELKRLRVDPVFMKGPPFLKHIAETERRFRESADSKASAVPDFTRYVIAIVAVLLVWMAVETLRNSTSKTLTTDEAESSPVFVEDNSHTKRPWTAALTFAVVSIYVFTLSQGWLPFEIATTVMVFVAGALMTRLDRKHRLIVCQLALLTGFGTQFVFTRIFETVLP